MISPFRYLWIFVCASVGVQNCRGDYDGSDNNNPCKTNYLDTCLKNALMNRTGLIGIPKSKNDVDAICKGFKIGMKCLDDYTSLCLTLDEKNMVGNNVIGAKYTFKFLCDDEAFQKDYLKYTDCYRVINSDWDGCVTEFMSLVRDQTNVNNSSEEEKVLNLCCAKHGFLNCVFTSSKIKCGLEEAIFLKKIADTLLENRSLKSSVCQQITIGHCNTAQQTEHHMFTIILNIIINYYILLNYLM